MIRSFLAACAFALAAASPASAQGGEELNALLRSLNIRQAGDGMVVNACDDAVAPQISPAELGGAVDRAYLVVIPGGPNSPTCYGDNPGELRLMRRDGMRFREIFRGAGVLGILPSSHLGVHDIALGGPGYRFPVYAWNGTTYAKNGKMISDTQFGEAMILP
jgi:hypothetical protein